MKPEELGAARESALLVNLMPYAKAELKRMEEMVINSAMTALSNDHLSPEVAQQKWIELVAYRRLLQRFEQRTRAAVSTGYSVSDVLDISNPSS